MTALLIEYLPVVASAPNGVKKLRELILQLAVMGKLVPQDPNDEPAGELLKRMRSERAGKTKGQLEPITAVDIQKGEFALPLGWLWVRLYELAENIQYGYTASADHSSSKVRMLRITDIQDDSVDWAKVPGCAIDARQLLAYSLTDGDIVIARTGGTIGKSYIVAHLNCEAVFASYLIRLKKLDSSWPPYIKTFLGSATYWAQLQAKSMGTGQPNVNGTALKSLLIPLPPLPEQHRIVAKVDELMALCDCLDAEQSGAGEVHKQIVKALLDTLTESTAQAEFAASWERIKQNFHAIFTTESSIDALKEALLEVAVTGKLEYPSTFSCSNEQLLPEVNERTSFTIKENLPSLLKVKGDQSELHLPIDWRWVSLRDLVVKSGSGWSPSCESRPRVGTEWGVLKVSAVSWGKFLPDMNKALPSSLSPRPDCEVKDGDFLISRANTKELVARSVVVRNCPPRLMMSDKIVRLQLSDLIDKDFLQLYNNSSLARAYYERVAGGTSSSMKNVTRDQILALPVPLPPLVVQQKLVRIVGEWFDVCDNLASQMAQSVSLSEDFASAVLENCL